MLKRGELELSAGKLRPTAGHLEPTAGQLEPTVEQMGAVGAGSRAVHTACGAKIRTLWRPTAGQLRRMHLHAVHNLDTSFSLGWWDVHRGGFDGPMSVIWA